MYCWKQPRLLKLLLESQMCNKNVQRNSLSQHILGGNIWQENNKIWQYKPVFICNRPKTRLPKTLSGKPRKCVQTVTFLRDKETRNLTLVIIVGNFTQNKLFYVIHISVKALINTWPQDPNRSIMRDISLWIKFGHAL